MSEYACMFLSYMTVYMIVVSILLVSYKLPIEYLIYIMVNGLFVVAIHIATYEVCKPVYHEQSENMIADFI